MASREPTLQQGGQGSLVTQSPPRVSDPPQDEEAEERPGAAMREQIGITKPPERRIAPFSKLFEETAREQARLEDRPTFEGFFGDVGTLLANTAEELKESFLTEMDPREATEIGKALNTPEGRARQIAKIEQGAMRRLKEDTNPSLFDIGEVAASEALAGAAGGAQFGLENLPVVGDFFEAQISPVTEELEQVAAETTQRQFRAMDSKLGGAVASTIPGFAGRLTGSLWGAWQTLKPWMFAGNVLLSGAGRARQAGSFTEAARDIGKLASGIEGGFVGDTAGFSLFGAATGERGFISATIEGPAQEEFGQRFGEIPVDPQDPWWKQSLAQTLNRTEAAAMMGLDGLAAGLLFATGAHGLLRMHRAARSQMAGIRNRLLGGDRLDPEKIVAMRQAQFFTDPGRRKMPVIRNAEEGKLVAELTASEEMLAKSPSAQQLLAEQASVEGVTSYQSQIAALAKAVDDLHVNDNATHGVIRGVEDPFRMFNEVRESSPIAERASTFPAQRAAEPLVHTPDEIPEQAVFGYTEGLTKNPLSEMVQTTQRDMPLFLKNEPKVPAVERGNVEEVVVTPGKTWDFNNWNEVLEQYGSIDDMVRAARSNSVEMVNVLSTGAKGGQQHIVLKPEAISSSKPVVNASQVGDEAVDAATVIREMAGEPLEVSLKRRLPEMRFETPVKRDDGTYDLIFSKEGAPGLNNEQLQQFKNTGFFKGQRVQYAGKTYEVVGRRGPEGQGKTIELEDPTTGDTVTPSVRNVFELPSARVEMDVDEALFRDFVRFFDDNMQRLGDRQPDEQALREMAMNADDPAVANRDFADQGLDAIIYPQEVMAPVDVAEGLAQRAQKIDDMLRNIGNDPNRAKEIQGLVRERLNVQRQIQNAAKQAQAEGRIPENIDLDEAFVDFPDQLDYGTLIFNRWARSKDIDMTPGEAQALKHNFFRRLNRDVFDKLPEGLRNQYSDMQEQLVQAWENLPKTPETLARMAGFELLRMKGGMTALRRPGKTEYEGLFTSDEALVASLNSSLRHGNVPNMTPQYNFLEANLPSGAGLGEVPGDVPDDMRFLTSDDALRYTSRIDEAGDELFLPKSKPGWLVPFEESSGIPLWSEYLSPLFKSKRQAGSKALPFMERWISHFKGLSKNDRKALSDFVRNVESHSEYVKSDKLRQMGADFGLNEGQLDALTGMRESMNEMFQLGTDWFGFSPQDYIFQYFSRIKPKLEGMKKAQISRSPQRMFGDDLPPEYDRFVSKYHREGMLPQIEEDPLVVGMKYIRSMFHERFVKGPFDRLRNLLDTKISDLPPTQARRIIDNMSATRRKQFEQEFGNLGNAPALPQEVRSPLSETLNYMTGYPTESSNLASRFFRGIGRAMGVKVGKEGAEQVVNSLMMELYGSTLGYRPKAVVRNLYQNMSNMFPRLGASAMNDGYIRATNNLEESFQRGIDEGWIDLTARGLPFGEQRVLNTLNKVEIETTEGMMGSLAGPVTSGLLKHVVLDGRMARFWKRFADKGLAGIGKTDWFNRVWAAEAQTAKTKPWLQRFINDEASEAALRKNGLKYWEKSIQDRFINLAENQGTESAMAFIRDQAASISNYNYEKAAQPTAMQRPEGRMFGMFGTWPIWRKDLAVRTYKNARSAKERVEFLTRQAVATGALAMFGLKNGADMRSWMSHEAILTYAGGPPAGAMIDMYELQNARVGKKWPAAKRLVRDNILRLAPPGRIFWEDVTSSIELASEDPTKGFYNLFFGRTTPDDRWWGSRVIEMERRRQQQEEASEEEQPLPQMPTPEIQGPAPQPSRPDSAPQQ